MIARYLEKGIRFTVRSSIPWSPRNRAAETRRTAPDWPGTIARISNQDGGDVTGNARAYGRWVGENVGRLSFYIVSPVTLAGSVDRRTWTLMVIWAADRAETYLLPGFVIVLGNRLLSCYDARARPAPPPPSLPCPPRSSRGSAFESGFSRPFPADSTRRRRFRGVDFFRVRTQSEHHHKWRNGCPIAVTTTISSKITATRCSPCILPPTRASLTIGSSWRRTRW